MTRYRYKNGTIIGPNGATISDGEAVAVHDANGDDFPVPTTGSAVVADGSVTGLNLPATATVINDGQQVNCQLNGTDTTLTFTIVDGAITTVTYPEPVAP